MDSRDRFSLRSVYLLALLAGFHSRAILAQARPVCGPPQATPAGCLLADYIRALASMQRALETTPRDTTRTLRRLSRELAAQRAPTLAAKAVFDSYHTSPDTSVRRVAAYADSVFKYVATRGDSIAKVLGHISEKESAELEAATRRDFTNIVMSMDAAFGALFNSPTPVPVLTSPNFPGILQTLDETFGRADARPSIWAWHAQHLRPIVDRPPKRGNVPG